MLVITDRDLWNDQIARPAGRLIFGWDPGDNRRRRSNPAPAPHVVRLADATAERDEITAAVKRIERSTDSRAAAARAVLADALERSTARVEFLAGLVPAFDAADAAHATAVAVAVDAQRTLDCCDPTDAVAAEAALATAKARLRQAHRAGLELLEGWRASAKAVCPELVAAQARAAELQTAIDALRAAGRDDDVLAVATEPAGDCPHWKALVADRAHRSAGRAA